MKIWRGLALTGLGYIIVGGQTILVQADDTQGMYRLYNPNSGEHFYTSSIKERNHLVKVGWQYEGGAWISPTKGEAVHRLYNPNAGDHHYTLKKEEKDALVKRGWKYEGVSWYSGGNESVYRLYNPNAKGAGAHHYTLYKDEYNQLMKAGWKGEGISWNAIDAFFATDAPQMPSTSASKEPRKVDVDITTTGGGEGDIPGSYRLLYSNKPFDAAPTLGTPFLEFSADMNMAGLQGVNDFYGMQFIIAGNEGGAAGSGQIGLDISYQSGTSTDFAQNRLSVKTVNFPAGAGIHGEQFYSINTSAVADAVASLSVQYYKEASGEFVVTRLNGNVVGTYKTKLTTPNKYILHAQINDWNGKTATLKLTNVQVKKNGKDITKNGTINLNVNGQTGSSFDLVANTSNWLVQGAY